jgi:putative ABC transport system permease protein
VLERTREIGVLRSLGATPARLARLFAAEGAAICALSLLLGATVSFPLGRIISDYFGERMFQTPLDAGASSLGIAISAAVAVALVQAVTAAALIQVFRQPATAALRYE